MKQNSWVSEASQGALLLLLIQPNASKTQVVGPHGEPPRLKIRIACPPLEGRANEELLAFLKKKLKVKATQLTLVRGEASRLKDVLCQGISPEDMIASLLGT